MTLPIARPHSRATALQWLLVAATSVALPAGPALASQLTYTPVDPSFGGNPLNGSFLLQSAQTQKRFPFPTEDLGIDEIGQIIQTNNGFLIQKGNQLFWVDNNGNAHPITLNKP
jgi:curli production assembly/transport component CsgF